MKKKKVDTEESLIIEILQLAYLVQVHTEFCIFIRFSGHVDKLEIDIRTSKENWQSEILETEFSTVYKEYWDERDPLAFYKAKRDILKRILQEKEIPYDDCDVRTYVVEDYTF